MNTVMRSRSLAAVGAAVIGASGLLGAVGSRAAGGPADPGGGQAEVWPGNPNGLVEGAPSSFSRTPPERYLDRALRELDDIVADQMELTGTPGVAVAVVHGDDLVYAEGFGVRNVETRQEVDADTVFQLASVSKSLSSTAVAAMVKEGVVAWDTPVVENLPGFRLGEDYPTDEVTVGDMFAHRSGLPDHAGDLLEDLGYSREQILARLEQLPMGAFRNDYAYTNYGLTAAAVSVANAASTTWEDLVADRIFEPLGMSTASMYYSDFAARPDRAVGHVKDADGEYVVADPPRQPQPQAPAGGASASVNDLAPWLMMLLDSGQHDGEPVVDEHALLEALTPQSTSSGPHAIADRSGFYGYGMDISYGPSGLVHYNHSGGFSRGAGTNIAIVPAADVAIVTLTNAALNGSAETINARFTDIVVNGRELFDWQTGYARIFASLNAPEGELVGQDPPGDPAPAGDPSQYVGSYSNDYFGPAVVAADGDALVLTLGPADVEYPLTHWDGDVFVFDPVGEMANPGSVSMATFEGGTLTLEFYDEHGLGTWTRD